MWTVFGGGHRLAAKPRMIVGASVGAKKKPGSDNRPGYESTPRGQRRQTYNDAQYTVDMLQCNK